MLLMYILTFPAFSAHLEKGRGVLPPNMAVVAKESHSHTFRLIVLCSCFFLCIFSKHFSCIFAPLQNNLCGGTGCYQGPPSKPYLVLASHGRKIRSFCACALSLWSLPSLSNEFVTRCSPFFLTVSKKKFGDLSGLQNEVKALRMPAKCVLQIGSLTNMVFNDERSN